MVIFDRRLKIGEGENSCPFDGVVKLVDALDGREIGLDCFNLGTGPPESFGGGINLRLIGDNDKVEAVFGADPGKLEADAGGGAGHNGKRVSFSRGRMSSGPHDDLDAAVFLSRNVL